MMNITMADARFWTARRALRWAGLFLLLLIAMPLVLGLTSARLARIDPGHDWRQIGRVAALTLFPVGIIAGTAWLWRDYRRHAKLGGGEPWQRRAADRRLAVSTVWRDCVLAGFVIGLCCAFAGDVPPGAPRIVLAAAATLAIVYGVVRSTVHYMRTIDEQERDANLWATYCGLTVYMALFFAQYIAARFAIAVPHVHEAIFLITAAVAGGAFLWKRFR